MRWWEALKYTANLLWPVAVCMLLGAFAMYLSVLWSGEEEYQGWTGHWETVVATAYTPSDPIDDAYHDSKGARWRWICADGTTDVRRIPYGVAVPLRRGEPWWPFGTRVIIPTGLGYLDRSRADEREFTVDDVGNGAAYFPSEAGHVHVDMRFIDRMDALRWAGPEGKRVIRVFVCGTRAPVHETIPVVHDTIWPKAEPMPKPVVRTEAPGAVVMEAAFPITELTLPGMIIVLGIHNRYRRRRSWEPGR